MQSNMVASSSAGVGYPIFVDLNGRSVVVIGGGDVAERKVATLLRSGARVTVVAPQVTQTLAQLASQDKIVWVQRAYAEGDLEGACLSFCACGDPDVDAAAHAEARRRNCLMNVVDVPADCDFIVPALVRRGRLGIAISTSGSACAETRRIREQLEEEFDESWEAYLDLMAAVRVLVKQRLTGPDTVRKPVFVAAAHAGWRERLANGEKIDAEDAYAEAVRLAQEEQS